jgi:hypothetical protein
MNKNRKSKLPVDEDSIRREERDNEVVHGIRELKHPHEKQNEVGSDQRDYLAEELEEQGYGEEGLIHRGVDRQERPNPRSESSHKIA